MYIYIGIFLIICSIFFVLLFFKRKKIMRKVRCMDFCDKVNLLNSIAQSFGFCYEPSQEIITSRIDAWQRQFGYCSFYDRTAHSFGMVFDCEPVYFDYRGHTWLIEFWKGQYGINVGGEVGIYRTERCVKPQQYSNTVFQAVPLEEMPGICIELNYKGRKQFGLCRRHWWLTGFLMGDFCEPEELTMNVSVSFCCEDMMNAFVESLRRTGYSEDEIYICCNTVTVLFSVPHEWQPRHRFRCRAAFAQWRNRFFCKWYLAITKPFTCTIDRLLYLYFFIPVAWRHMFCFKRNRRQKFNRKAYIKAGGRR